MPTMQGGINFLFIFKHKTNRDYFNNQNPNRESSISVEVLL